MMIFSAESTSFPTFTAFGPVKTASPLTTWTLFMRSSALTPEVSLSTTEARKAWTFSQSTRTSAPMMPMFPLQVAASYTSELCSMALVGMQPRFRQVPPSSSFSTRVTLAPSWAARMAAT